MKRVGHLEKKTLSAGFTLIELTIVVTIIGVLAATSLPKFASMTNMAQIASAQGVQGSLSAAIDMARSQWQALSQPASITMDGNNIVMGSSGWPESSTGVADGTATPAKCLEVWTAIMHDPPPAGVTCTGKCQYLVAVSVNPICLFIDYQGQGTNTISYNISTGLVQLQQ